MNAIPDMADFEDQDPMAAAMGQGGQRKIKAFKGDRWGNLIYRKAARNFGPIMAMAAKCTIAQVDEVVSLGTLDPEAVVTPGIFVQRVVEAQRLRPCGAEDK